MIIRAGYGRNEAAGGKGIVSSIVYSAVRKSQQSAFLRFGWERMYARLAVSLW